MSKNYDLLIVGAGINGAGIARDAAGQGLKVLLCDAGDIGAATSSASTKLIHGGLRYLEFYEFALVRKALKEREVILRIAPHISWPVAFVLPHVPDLRPAWMIRAGLYLYDHLARRIRVPGSCGISLQKDPAGACLLPSLTRGFRYWDGWVEDSRLTILNALDAHKYGADIAPRNALLDARADQGRWVCRLADGTEAIARVLINAAGPWVNTIAAEQLHLHDAPSVRMVKGSHIVVPRVNPTEDAYFFQQPDGRAIFMLPYEKHFSLIGTTEGDYQGDPRKAMISEEEVTYLLAAVNRFLRIPLSRSCVRWSYAGVRPLVDEGGESRTVSRDFKLVPHTLNQAHALSVIGGKITTYRVLAEQVLQRIAPWLDFEPHSWTGDQPLPGGERAAQPPAWLPQPMAERMQRFYGSRMRDVLGEAQTLDDMGPCAGGLISAQEVRYMVDHEWLSQADDLLWRRTKLGLHIPPEEHAKIADWIVKFSQKE